MDIYLDDSTSNWPLELLFFFYLRGIGLCICQRRKCPPISAKSVQMEQPELRLVKEKPMILTG